MTGTNSDVLYPLLFQPVLKDYIWGGRNLSRLLGRELPPGKDIAESWEIAAHDNGDVTVINGPLTGKTLSELSREMGEALIGTRGAWALVRHKFPLLIKLLDANRKLSVQVHPDDDYAKAHEGNELGKTEMWVILHAEEGASLILGVKEETTPERFRKDAETGRLENHLHEIPVRTGDFVCVPSGSLHAILEGLLIAEIQQNSDVTYRVYDWNRTGADGQARPLHLERAMEVINFQQIEPGLPDARRVSGEGDDVQRWELCRNAYFVVERVEMPPTIRFHDVCNGRSLQIWGVVEGSATIEGGGENVDLPAVRFALLPARLGPYSLMSGSEHTTLLRAFLA